MKKLQIAVFMVLTSILALLCCSCNNKGAKNEGAADDTAAFVQFKNDEFKSLVAKTLDKDASTLTAEDLGDITALDVYYYAERIENTMQYKDVWSITVKKKGFNEVFDIYYNTPKEEREGLESPENYYENVQLEKFEGYEDIKLLTGLTEISLNSEYKIIDIDPVKYFKNITGLRELSIYNYVVSDLTEISKFTELTNLSVGLDQKQVPDGMDVTYIGDISPLANLTKLESLSLSGNHISDLTPIVSLDSLKDLSVTHAALGDISPVANMKNLESVNFFFNGIENVAPLTAIPTLKYIHLDYNYIQDLTPFASLDPNVVEYVSVDMNGFQDAEPLRHLGTSKVNLGYDPAWEE